MSIIKKIMCFRLLQNPYFNILQTKLSDSVSSKIFSKIPKQVLLNNSIKCGV